MYECCFEIFIFALNFYEPCDLKKKKIEISFIHSFASFHVIDESIFSLSKPHMWESYNALDEV